MQDRKGELHSLRLKLRARKDLPLSASAKEVPGQVRFKHRDAKSPSEKGEFRKTQVSVPKRQSSSSLAMLSKAVAKSTRYICQWGQSRPSLTTSVTTSVMPTSVNGCSQDHPQFKRKMCDIKEGPKDRQHICAHDQSVW